MNKAWAKMVEMEIKESGGTWVTVRGSVFNERLQREKPLFISFCGANTPTLADFNVTPVDAELERTLQSALVSWEGGAWGVASAHPRTQGSASQGLLMDWQELREWSKEGCLLECGLE